jgi:hypothetical protein
MVRECARHSGIDLDEATIASMHERSTRHSKYPDVFFREEEAKEAALLSMADVDRWFRQLDSFATLPVSA